MTPDAKDTASEVAKKNLPKDAKIVIADAKNDITIPFFSDILQPTDDTLIKRGGGKGLALYDEIERDTHAGSVLRKRKTTLVGREWEVTPGGERPIDLEAADMIEEQLKRLSFDRICEDLLDATLKGFAISEVVWERDGNRIQPRKIVSHDQRRFVFDLDWRPRLLTLANMHEGIELPDRKFMVHRFGVKGNNPYGLGLGSSLFWPVLFKREGVAFWLAFLDKFASPTVVGKTPYGLPDNEQLKLLNTLAGLVRNSAITVPMGVDVSLLEASRSGSVSYEDWCRYWDGQMSIRTLGETLTTDIGKAGSRAASETHHDILELLVDADADLLSTTLNETLFQWLVDYNFPGAKVPHVWRIRAADELKDAEVKEKKASASIKHDEAIAQIVATANKFEDDDDAREYIASFAPDTLDDDMLDRLVKARHAFGAASTPPAMDDPKKKDLIPTEPDPEFAEGDAEQEGDIQAAITDQLIERTERDEARKVSSVLAALDTATDLEDAARQVLQAGAAWSVDGVAEVLTDAFAAASLNGREAVLEEMDEDAGFADPDVFNQPFKEQVDFFTQKEPRPTKEWRDVMRGDHDRAFVVAGVKDRAMLQDFQQAIGKAIKDGTTLEEFRKDFDAIVARYGWSYNGERGWRSRTIYATNIHTSYMAGRLKQMLDPAVLKARPYWEYVHGQTRKPKVPRRQHLAWNGLILPADDPVWSWLYPPNGWECSCGVRTRSKRDLERMGKKGPDTPPAKLMEPWLDKKTGKLTEKVQGIGFGWDHQPGGLWARGLTPSQIDQSKGKLAFDVDEVEPLADMIANAKPFKSKKLATGKGAEFYVGKFMGAFGAKLGQSLLFKDKAGDQVLISDELFRDARGKYKVLKRDRQVHAAQLAEAIKDPDEIWIGVAERAIPEDQGGGVERVLDRKYIRVDPKTGLLAIFELFQDTWSGKTAFHPLKKKSIKTDVNQIDRRRGGKLLYKRGQ